MFAIVREPIDPAQLAQSVRDDGCGAVAIFSGVVRERSDDDRPVTGLSYEAYEPMALHDFAAIAREANERFGPCRVAIVHRVGDLAIGEIAVCVAVACGHRAAAFDACEYCIDEVKARAPIWKHERYADGAAGWIENACGHSRS